MASSSSLGFEHLFYCTKCIARMIQSSLLLTEDGIAYNFEQSFCWYLRSPWSEKQSDSRKKFPFVLEWCVAASFRLTTSLSAPWDPSSVKCDSLTSIHFHLQVTYYNLWFRISWHNWVGWFQGPTQLLLVPQSYCVGGWLEAQQGAAEPSLFPRFVLLLF